MCTIQKCTYEGDGGRWIVVDDPIACVPLSTTTTSSSLPATCKDAHHASTTSFMERHEPARDTSGARILRWKGNTAPLLHRRL